MITIRENGMEFVMAPFEDKEDHKCDNCKAVKYCGAKTELNSCCNTAKFTCTSATKITEESKVYCAANRDEAKHLVGKFIDIWMDYEWTNTPIILTRVNNVIENSFDNDTGTPASIIRESNTVTMTFSEIQKRYPELENVVLVGE